MAEFFVTLNGNDFKISGVEALDFPAIYPSLVAWMTAVVSDSANPQQGQLDALTARLRSNTDRLSEALSQAQPPPV